MRFLFGILMLSIGSALAGPVGSNTLSIRDPQAATGCRGCYSICNAQFSPGPGRNACAGECEGLYEDC
ncbi:hypothetical protein COCC4DRAFT_122987 [Bipolaris maydis ATCC 48331]|uniref:Uncharacterized protein n=1 Tax=Cochliobolus heterostrophus (strain C4 / ATCC 48331 / race T) TaxID=665024 RepID=N4Y0I7_COCH4|nr:uncharacterized protein COCC4DRAFT_122987 [Bipolaris maydis ATCC 48331]ENI10972.1 hypothetical protein COCC4DRAFT_122987 [Bipolaris maydis ATCC 48331]